MSNDGWGKLPTNNGGWGVPKQDAWPAPKSSDGWAKPAVSDGWGEYGSGTSWPSDGRIYADASRANVSDEVVVEMLATAAKANEATWVHDSLAGAEERARVINALKETRGQEYVVSQDGELDKVQEVVPTVSKGETGFYLAYHNGKMLHAILSGPYNKQSDAFMMADQAFDMLTLDPSFKLAFENNFQRSGVYVAEIPLSAKRHGAFGVLT